MTLAYGVVRREYNGYTFGIARVISIFVASGNRYREKRSSQKLIECGRFRRLAVQGDKIDSHRAVPVVFCTLREHFEFAQFPPCNDTSVCSEDQYIELKHSAHTMQRLRAAYERKRARTCVRDIN